MRYPGLRPGNVTATDEERETLLFAARPAMRLFILLCSDLGIRSGTSCKLGPDDYDTEKRELRFVTKYGSKVTLPVTAEIETHLNLCDMRARNSPFVLQLARKEDRGWRANLPEAGRPKSDGLFNHNFAKLKRQVGIERKITPHDLRRTTAVGMLEATGDVRSVRALLGHRSLQSTIWYLDHDLRPVKRSLLEIIKRPAGAKIAGVHIDFGHRENPLKSRVQAIFP